MSTAFFRSGDQGGAEVLIPQPLAFSGWGEGQLRGLAVSGAMARAAEHAARDRSDLRPARWTVDLFRAAVAMPSTLVARVVRSGRRLCLVEVSFDQDGRTVARATALYLRPGDDVHGATWAPPGEPAPPPESMEPTDPERRLYFSEPIGWSISAQRHQNASHKQTWHLPLTIVDGEVPSPFQVTACFADVTSLVTNWGSEGLEYINTDISLHLSRLPIPGGVGLSALSRAEADGVAVGSALVFDRKGVLGLAATSALANSQHTVDPRLW